MDRRKYMTFLEKAQTYMSADYGVGVLIMIFGYSDKILCGDFNSSSTTMYVSFILWIKDISLNVKILILRLGSLNKIH